MKLTKVDNALLGRIVTPPVANRPTKIHILRHGTGTGWHTAICGRQMYVRTGEWDPHDQVAQNAETLCRSCRKSKRL